MRSSLEARAQAVGLELAPEDPDAATADASSALTPLSYIGRTIGGCELKRLVGCGGMGCVYEARQQRLERTVAVKLIRPRALSQEARERLLDEARLLAKLNHEHIARVHDAGTHTAELGDGEKEELAYIVMEYLPLASPITEHARRRNLTLDERLALMIDACDAVEYVHTKGVLHRDLKPSNILVTGGLPACVKVIDFGLASSALHLGVSGTKSEVGTLAGTFQYMSPEQCLADPHVLAPASDAYALGLVLYELLTDEVPYIVPAPTDEGRLAQALQVIQYEEPAPPRRQQNRLPPDLEHIVLRSLDKDPVKRYRYPRELAAELRRFRAGKRLSDKPLSPARLMREANRTVGRRPLLASAIAVVMLALLAELLLVPLVYRWTSLHDAFDKWLVSVASATGPVSDGLADFRLVRITDAMEASLESLAADVGVEGVTREDWSSVRRLHGRLMERLAEAQPRAVIFDIRFPSATAHDDAFLRGVRALEQRNVDVVVAVDHWDFDEAGYPGLSRNLLGRVRYGRPTAGFDPADRCFCLLTVTRPPRETMNSLAVEAFGAVRRPGWQVRATVDPDDATLFLRYLRSTDPEHSSVVRWDGMEHELAAGGVYVYDEDPQLGLQQGDLISYALTELPAPPQVDAVSVDFADAIRSDAQTCRDLFDQRVVVIGDFRAGADTPPGHTQPLVIGQMATIAALLQDASVRVERTGGLALAFFPGLALVGVALPQLSKRRRIVVPLALVLGSALLVAGSLLAYKHLAYLVNPTVYLIVLILGVLAGAWVVRQRQAYI